MRLLQESTVKLFFLGGKYYFFFKVDAFVAMGGNPDRSGWVQRDTLINIIKNEFELTFDMENFLEALGGPITLDFETFC